MDSSPPVNLSSSSSRPQIKLIATGIILILLLSAIWLVFSRRSSPLNQPSPPSSESTTDIPVPVYPDASLTDSQVTTETEFELQFFHGTWETDTQASSAVQWYTDQLTAQGWTVNVPFKEPSQQPGTMMSIWKPTDPSYAFVEITITPLDSTTQIQVTYFPDMDVLYPEDEEEEEGE